MRTSQYFLPTIKETPADAEIISHQLMIRAGLIRKVAAGIYTWLPLGMRVLQNVIKVVREEMDRIGGMEILMPAVQPAELWQETKRWYQYGAELLKIKDRHQRDFVIGPTHEEVITDLVRGEFRSYKQLPATLYQIQTKFRDEIRPRFGVMRAREFIMKDAYSFHENQKSLEQTYLAMYEAYSKIFARLGLQFRAVQADTGSIGGNFSHEFQVLAQSGEDVIAYSDGSEYAANIELASALTPENSSQESQMPLQKVDTPKQYTIEAVVNYLNVDIKKTIKTLIVLGKNKELVALLLRGDHELNTIKAEKLNSIATPLQFAPPERIQKEIGCDPGSIGPLNLSIPMIVDNDVVSLMNFICGANENDKHFMNVNWKRDLPLPPVADLRKVVEGDLSPDGKGKLHLTRGIEVGHIFQLGNKYSAAMGFTVLDESGKAITPLMGCYGIGISRIVAAAIEQHHDEHGILWPDAMAPFSIALVPLSYHKSYRVREAADQLYDQLRKTGFDVLMDDRKERAGVLFADMDLIGIPHRLVISERGLDNCKLEYKARTSPEPEDIDLENAVAILKKRFSEHPITRLSKMTNSF